MYFLQPESKTKFELKRFYFFIHYAIAVVVAFQVGEPPDKIYPEDAENVFDAKAYLVVGFQQRGPDKCRFGIGRKTNIGCMLVVITQAAPQAPGMYYLAPF